MIHDFEVKQAMIKANITSVFVRECSLCNYPLAYVRDGENIYFDSGCDCTRGGPNYSHRDWSDVSDWINSQVYEDRKNELMKKFGLEVVT